MSLYGFADAAHQAWMVLDRVRTETYARALRLAVQPGDVVLDIGTGSGVLAMLAARAGAKKVFAVERTRAHALARAHVREAGLEDTVEVLHTDLLALTSLPQRPTLVIGEVLGHFAPDESMHALYRHARTLSVPDVRMLPLDYHLTIGLASLDALRSDLAYLAHGLSVPLGAMAARLVRRPKAYAVPRGALLSAEVETAAFSTWDEEPSVFTLDLPLERGGEANALVVAFRSTLTPGVAIDTRASADETCWRQMVFPIEPLLVHAGETVRAEIEPRVLSHHDTYRWRVEGRAGVRSLDGLDAFGELTPHELARAVGLAPSPSLKSNTLLRAWALALRGGADVSLDQMVENARGEIPDPLEARRAVLAMLRGASALDE